jgi:hypothetical protein
MDLPGRPGRRPVPAEVRALAEQLVLQNQRWGCPMFGWLASPACSERANDAEILLLRH